MKTINIADAKKRNTRVALDYKKRPNFSRRVDQNKEAVESIRVVKSTLDTDFKKLTADISPEELSQKIIDGDPEIDFETFGKQIHDTVRIYLNDKNQPAGAVIHKELVYSADGELTEERDLREIEANINSELPLQWSGKLMPKADCIKKFVFTNAFQLKHVDGLTFDFLFNMAKELDEKNSMLFLGAGKKSNEPLTLSRNGKQYRAFLEGRVRENSYMLILHLTNLELKSLPKKEEE